MREISVIVCDCLPTETNAAEKNTGRRRRRSPVHRSHCDASARFIVGMPPSLVDLDQWLLAIVAAVAALAGAAPRPPTCAASLRYGTDGKEDP